MPPYRRPAEAGRGETSASSSTVQFVDEGDTGCKRARYQRG